MKKKIIKCGILGLFAGFINGLLGSGGGSILVPGMLFLLKSEEHHAHATSISIILPLTLISTFIYSRNGMLEYGVAFKVAIGGMFGGYLGAKLLNKIPNKLLRRIFALVLIVAAIRMVIKWYILL